MGHTGRNALEIADDRLAAIVAAWEFLPEPIRAGIVAMVRSVDAQPTQQGKGAGR